jgi:hypothetical protein
VQRAPKRAACFRRGRRPRRQCLHAVDSRAIAPACRASGSTTGGRSSCCKSGVPRRPERARPYARAGRDWCWGSPWGQSPARLSPTLSRWWSRELSRCLQVLRRSRSPRPSSRWRPPRRHPRRLARRLPRRHPHCRRPQQTSPTRLPSRPRPRKRQRRTANRRFLSRRRTRPLCGATKRGKSRRDCDPLASIRG